MTDTNLSPPVSRVLVVGGGIAGMAAAIRLRERGVDVDLIDKDPDWRVSGAGITLSILTFRALCDLGLKDELVAQGHAHDGVTLNDHAGNVIREVRPEHRFAPDVPAEGGVLRPVLHAIMSKRVLALGTQVRLGMTIDHYEQDGRRVFVTLSDGTTGAYDLVIGADGLFSRLRTLTFPDAPKPRFTGQACWRMLFDTPRNWIRGQMFLATELKVGFTPCTPTKMYMYLLESVPGNPRRDKDELPHLLKGLLKGFGGVVGELRDTIDASSQIIYRPLEAILVDGDWFKGRVVLIGDAVHATTPHLGSGAGMAVEDAIVLVDELWRASSLEAGLRAFMTRRLPRGRFVVGNSIRLGEMEMSHAPMVEQAALMQDCMRAISEPY